MTIKPEHKPFVIGQNCNTSFLVNVTNFWWRQ